jgi:hypothetical protein
MPPTTLRFDYLPDGESLAILLDGEELITVDHGQYGWAGMEGVKNAFERAARKSWWVQEVTGDPCI